MNMTIEQVLAARNAKLEAAKFKGSQLPGRLEEIVELLNGGGLWVDILEYLHANGTRTNAGAAISRSYLIDWCTLHVPPHDAAMDTPEAVVAGRRVSLTGAGQYARRVAAKRLGKAPHSTSVTAARIPAAQVPEPVHVPLARVVEMPRARIVNPFHSDATEKKPGPSPERMAEMIAKMRQSDEEVAMAKATGKL